MPPTTSFQLCHWQQFSLIFRIAAFVAACSWNGACADLTNAVSLAVQKPWPSRTAFTNAMLATSESAKLPRVERWDFATDDLLQPMGFTLDLAEHKKQPFITLWPFLSPGTQEGLLSKRAHLRGSHSVLYAVGPEIDALVADLNRLVKGPLLFGGEPPANAHLSGDTLQLLALKPTGEQLTRLNRLLIEDAFELDILRRPKILANPVSHSYLIVDFKKSPPDLKTTTATLSLYDERGTKHWTTDLNSSTRDKKRSYPYYRVASTQAWGANVGIWDVQFRGELIAIHLMRMEGVGLDIDTGTVKGLLRW